AQLGYVATGGDEDAVLAPRGLALALIAGSRRFLLGLLRRRNGLLLLLFLFFFLLRRPGWRDDLDVVLAHLLENAPEFLRHGGSDGLVERDEAAIADRASGVAAFHDADHTPHFRDLLLGAVNQNGVATGVRLDKRSNALGILGLAKHALEGGCRLRSVPRV